eukprot:1007319-Alexandrium_andersonii.AAC.1
MRRRRRASRGASCAWQCNGGWGLRLSPIRSRGEGHLARWAHGDRRPLGLDFGAPSSLRPATKVTGYDLRPMTDRPLQDICKH